MPHFFTDKNVGVDKIQLQKKIKKRKLLFMNQVHSATVKVVDKDTKLPIKECDAIITRDKDVALCVVVADCNPVIIWDDTQGVVAVAHAGRVGSYSSIVKKTILKLEKEFMCHKENLNVSIGPSIRECCYEVGAEVIDGFEEYVVKRDGKLFLDLIQLNLHDLKKVGIKKENIEVSPICTCCNKNYFSYRREATKERFCGVAYLE